MSEARSSSKRRLEFSSPPVSRSAACTLCNQFHTQLSSPKSWKNDSCRQFALSLDISEYSLVCRPCRNDITRLTKDPSHCPRWEKCRVTECIIPQCKNTFFSKCSIPHDDIIQCLTSARENIPPNLDIPPPLCKHHYHLVYNAYQPTQTHCPTCGAVLQKQSARPCPNTERIQSYLAENTGYEGVLKDGDKVCFACYKSHLQILKHSQIHSLDTDLVELIQVVKSSIIHVNDVRTVDDAIGRAMSMTTVYVGEAILRQEGLLLPNVHNFFLGQLKECISIPASEKEQVITARWILSNLTSSLQQHLSYVCKIRRCGTLLYRTNGDIFVALTNALHKLSHYSRPTSVESTCYTEKECSTTANVSDNMQVALNDVNSAMHEQIQMFLKADAICPYRFDRLDINSLIPQINPTLWRAICSITQSVSERRGKGKVSDFTSHQHVKTVRRFFCLCVLMFCTNDRCYTPVHNLITDMVDGLGGSTLLIKILNRLGVCSSADTLARSIQFRVTEREERGLENECSATSFTIVSIDNIDFLHSYARVFCGDQKRSWHGTTVQVVQPQPTKLHVNECTGNFQSVGESTSDQRCTDKMDGSRQPQSVNAPQQHVPAYRRRKRDVDRPYASPSSKSPVPKICRRARSAMETSKICSSTAQQISSTEELRLHISQPPMHEALLSDFKTSSREKKSLDQLCHDLYTYLWLKQNSKSCSNFVGLQEYFALTRPREDEKSNIVYFDVLNAVADKKETVLLVLDKLRKQIVERHRKQWLVVAGDAKLYDVLKTIKHEYGDEFKWLICYPGDWHMLAIFQKAIMKPYFDAGLKQLAKTAGYPTPAIQACSQFKRTHHFIVEAWEAIFQVMLHMFMENTSHDPIAESVKQQLLDSQSPHSIETMVATLKMSLSSEYKHFITYLQTKSENSENWKFWTQFILRDGLAYVGMYLALRSGNWNLRVACMKMMVPIFCAYDHMTYKQLICHHIADILTLPEPILKCFSKGGFVVSVTGTPWHSVAVDEAHEMCINKSCKMAVVHPTQDYMHRVANYIPYRNRCLENLREQLFPEEKKVITKLSSLETTNASTKKHQANVETLRGCINGVLLTETQELHNYSGKPATQQQRQDLMNFYSIGEKDFERYAEYNILRRPSTQAPNRKRKLVTFSERKVTKTQVNQLEKDKKIVTKCLHRRLKWHQQTGQPVQTLAEQYIPFPLAISDNKGNPIKGQKSNTTKFFEKRYKNSVCPVILNNTPPGWTPQCVVLEGMFIINTSPLGTHKTYGEYALFLLRRFITSQFYKGCREVHILFDNPERLKLPKNFERERRDKISSVSVHTCDTIEPNNPIPPKWRESVINCRQCKRSLTVFLTKYWLNKISPYLQGGMALYIAGGFEGDIEDTAWFVSDQSSPQPLPTYRSNAEETDTRIWLHVSQSSFKRIYIVSPDTDVYHVGLPFDHGNKEILIEVNVIGSTQKRILSLLNLKKNFTNDPDLSSIPSHLLPQIFQTLYVVTGCDYTSFFSGFGKTTFMKFFYQHGEFITSGTTHPGSLSDCSLETNSYELGFLAFLRLIGTIYFKKYASAFTATTPQSHYSTFTESDGHIPVKDQHINWLTDIRNSIWDRTEFENNMIPSIDSLYRHWTRTCWVLDMWAQAASNQIMLKPLHLYGWKMNDGILMFDWDSETNIKKVQNRVHGLLKGCKCTKGCRTKACGCRRQGKTCSEGCQCNGCVNLSRINDGTIEEEQGRGMVTTTGGNLANERGEDGTEGTHSWEVEDGFTSEVEYDSDTSISTENSEKDLNAEVDQIMQSVFGENDTYSENSEEEV